MTKKEKPRYLQRMEMKQVEPEATSKQWVQLYFDTAEERFAIAWQVANPFGCYYRYVGDDKDAVTSGTYLPLTFKPVNYLAWESDEVKP